MFNKLKLFWELFQNGKAATQKGFWRQQQAYVVPVVLSLLLGAVELARSFNVQIPLDEVTCNYVALALYGVVNTCLSVITSTKLGLPSGELREAQQALPEPPQAVGEQEGMLLVNASSTAPTEPPSGLSDETDDTSAGDTLARAREWLAKNSRMEEPPTYIN